MIRIGLVLFSREIKLTESQLTLKNKLDKLSNVLNNSRDKSIFPLHKSRDRSIFSFHKARDLVPRGVYIYGGVGQGKTMLMDSFYDTLKIPKNRIHFHEFMIQIQQKLHHIKTHHTSNTNSTVKSSHITNNTTNGVGSGVKNVMELVCDEIVKNYKLLCLDEFHVTHISDAMILKELFTTLFNKGLVLVCTSNRAPEELYKNGLNRDRFLPFIPILYQYCDVYHLDTENFRQKQNNSGVTSLTDGDNEDNSVYNDIFCMNKDMEYFITKYANGVKIDKSDVRERWIQVTPLRRVRIPLTHGKVAFLTFSDLFPNNSFIGIDALIKLSEEFNTFVMTEIPEFNANLRYNNKLKIFIQFIDILYEKNLKLVLSTSKPLIYIFGSYGIIKLFDQFYHKVKSTKLDKQQFNVDDFIELNKLDTTKSDSVKLFEAMLLPNERVLTTQRLSSIINTHEQLINGSQPKQFILYKFDTNDEEADEEEFQCSRTLSRLFHMSTQDYLSKC
ncbi:AFG1-like ATPase family protein [Theileria parva strain Muguga]|uniref:AFG1-like ATPase family protein n=1 Tax=Theileria parva strain Muguga TaxID=333668 RepID=UPI001C619BBD|nr:AFG1-like ATPase family protein [Theileria parva strain Muguga]EAN30749.2 AFG1-like ATPase family protein [Theileria parva strain Muguga]